MFVFSVCSRQSVGWSRRWISTRAFSNDTNYAASLGVLKNCISDRFDVELFPKIATYSCAIRPKGSSESWLPVSVTSSCRHNSHSSSGSAHFDFQISKTNKGNGANSSVPIILLGGGSEKPKCWLVDHSRTNQKKTVKISDDDSTRSGRQWQDDKVSLTDGTSNFIGDYLMARYQAARGVSNEMMTEISRSELCSKSHGITITTTEFVMAQMESVGFRCDIQWVLNYSRFLLNDGTRTISVLCRNGYKWERNHNSYLRVNIFHSHNAHKYGVGRPKDFDLVVVAFPHGHPDAGRVMFVFPLQILIDKGIAPSENSPGKSVCGLFDRTAKNMIQWEWTKDYLVDLSDSAQLKARMGKLIDDCVSFRQRVIG